MRDIIYPLKIQSQRRYIRAIFQSRGRILASACNGVREKNSIRFPTRMGWTRGRNLLFYHCPDGAHVHTHVVAVVCARYGSTIHRKSYVSRATDILRFYVPVFQITKPYPAFAASASRSENKAGRKQVDTHTAANLRGKSPPRFLADAECNASSLTSG